MFKRIDDRLAADLRVDQDVVDFAVSLASERVTHGIASASDGAHSGRQDVQNATDRIAGLGRRQHCGDGGVADTNGGVEHAFSGVFEHVAGQGRSRKGHQRGGNQKTFHLRSFLVAVRRHLWIVATCSKRNQDDLTKKTAPHATAYLEYTKDILP